jgi:hypothetical protein
MHHPNPIAILLVVFVALGVSVVPVRAQAPAREQLERLPSTPLPGPAEEQPAKETSETSDELGPIIVLKREPRYQAFRVFSDSQYVYESNVLLTPSNAEGDTLYSQTVGASFAPRLIKNLVSTAYVRYQWLRYDTLNNLDFDAMAAGLSLQRPVRDWFVLSGGFEAIRYTLRETDDNFLENFDVSFGIRRGQYLHERVFLYYGYQFDWLPTSPSDMSSVNNAGYAGVNIALLQPLTLQLAYRLRGLSYYQDSRFDYDNTVNASLLFRFKDYVTVRGYVGYVYSNSDTPIFDYETFTAGVGLGLSLRF